jgi:hypothetical protein
MFLKEGILIIGFCFLAGCMAWAPTMVATGTTGIYYYHNGKAEDVYRVPMEKAYVSAIRTMKDLGLEIIEIKRDEHRRIITAHALPSKCRITVDLEDVGDGKYIKASFKAVKHTVLHDRLYSGLIIKEFNNNLGKIKNEHLELKQIREPGGD